MSDVGVIDGTWQRLDLARFLGSVDGVPALPQVTRRILDVVDDPAGTPRQLHDIILHDPAPAARVLKSAATGDLPRFRVRAISARAAAGVVDTPSVTTDHIRF